MTTAIALPGSTARVRTAGKMTVQVALFAALGAVGLVAWGALVEPGWTTQALTFSALAALGSGVPRHLVRGRSTVLGAGVGFAIVVAAALLLSGVPADLLLPTRWPTLASRLADGAQGAARASLPISGGDVWARRTLLLSGASLVLFAALLTRMRRGRLAAAAVLTVVYAVAVSQVEPAHPSVSGGVFAVALAAFVWADTVGAGLPGTASALVVAATLCAMVAAPVLDRDTTWLDALHITGSGAVAQTTEYQWDQTYGPLNWPRRGDPVLHVATPTASYWKAAVLDGFDGRAWRRAGSVAQFEPDSDRRMARSGWTRRIRVTVGDLRSSEFVAAGENLGIQRATKPAVAEAGGFFVTSGSPLEHGDRYTATVYTPRPSARQLDAAGTHYPSFARLWLQADLQGVPVRRDARSAGAALQVSFPPFGSHEQPLLSFRGTGSAAGDGRSPAALVRASTVGRIYDLAQQLRERARTPAGFARAVQARVQRGATYTESPRVTANPLDTFLFADHRGHCQHFSGAMALLLRMGGVPARVAVGFAPGVYDRRNQDFVVTDLDAHAWVEAYFPHIGWVTFDPTPAASPARAQVADLGPAPTGSLGRRGAAGGDLPTGGSAVATEPGTAAGIRWLRALAGLLALAGVAAVLRRRRRARLHVSAVPPELRELERALRRTQWRVGPGLTLDRLEDELGGGSGYLDAVRLQRFGRSPGPGPSRSQRAALRRVLAHGRGLAGALRAWRALPPHPPWRRLRPRAQ